MKIINDYPKVDASFPKPGFQSGYIVYQADTGDIIGNFTKLAEIRKHCSTHNFYPLDVVVMQKLTDGKEEKLKPMFLQEYAFRTYETEMVGGACIERAAWSWFPPNGTDLVDVLVDEDSTNMTLQVNSVTRWQLIKIRLRLAFDPIITFFSTLFSAFRSI